MSEYEAILQALREDEAEVQRRLANGTPAANSPRLPLPQSPRETRLTKHGQVSAINVLLRALAALPQPCSYADLILACWRASPMQFGLPGYESDYPDTNRVGSVLYGHRGAIGQGLVRRVPGEGKQFELTEAARKRKSGGQACS